MSFLPYFAHVFLFLLSLILTIELTASLVLFSTNCVRSRFLYRLSLFDISHSVAPNLSLSFFLFLVSLSLSLSLSLFYFSHSLFRPSWHFTRDQFISFFCLFTDQSSALLPPGYTSLKFLISGFFQDG